MKGFAQRGVDVKAVSYELGVCPVCGMMADDIRRFANGSYMGVHRSELRPFVGRATGAVMMIECAVICHGSE